MKDRLKKMSAVFFAITMAFSITACGNADRSVTTQSSGAENGNIQNNITESGSVSNTESSAESESDNSGADGTAVSSEDGNNSNILVAYFSLAGEQYNVGVIEEGNTSIIAHMIAQQTEADLFEIKAVTPYPEKHSELLDVSQQEIADNARPEIAETVENMEDYDTVFIGYPNWWGDMPMIVYNFIESYDFSGKTIVPFCTHGGSGLSGTERTISDITGAVMMDGFAISGETAQNDRKHSGEEVTAWLQEGGFIE